jgi:hypothetical protein
MIGGIRGRFEHPDRPAPLEPALEAIPDQLEAGFTAICFKPSQYVDDIDEVGPLCRRVVAHVESLVR